MNNNSKKNKINLLQNRILRNQSNLNNNHNILNPQGLRSPQAKVIVPTPLPLKIRINNSRDHPKKEKKKSKMKNLNAVYLLPIKAYIKKVINIHYLSPLKISKKNLKSIKHPIQTYQNQILIRIIVINSMINNKERRNCF